MLTFNGVDLKFLESSKHCFSFHIDLFCQNLLNNVEGYEFSVETLHQLLILDQNIKADDEIDLSDVSSNIEIYKKSYYSRRFLSTYMEKAELDVEDLNNIILKAFCMQENNHIFYSNKENIKRLMRVVKVDNDFYLENIEKLSKFYNILKRNNENLKDDGVKLVNAIEVKKPTLEEEIENKYNLSSKQVFTLPPKYFLTHYWHFNFDGIRWKYPDEMDFAVTNLLLDIDMIRGEAYAQKLTEFIKSDNPNREQILKNLIISLTDIDISNNGEDVLNFIDRCVKKTRGFEDIQLIDWMVEILKGKGLNFPEGYPVNRISSSIIQSLVYRSSLSRDILNTEITQDIFNDLAARIMALMRCY